MRENTSNSSFIKWSLGVQLHRKSSNIGAWGDSGQVPILLTITKKLLDYFQRVKNAQNDMVYHAFGLPRSEELTSRLLHRYHRDLQVKHIFK